MKPNTIKSIRDTFLYQSMNASGAADKIIKTALTKGKMLSANDLEFEVATINRYYKYPLKKAVIDAFTNGDLKAVVIPQAVEERISQAIPFILGGVGNKMVAYAFIDNYAKYNKKDDNYSIDPKKLYAILEGAYMALIIQQSFRVIARSNVACVEGGSIFAHTFVRPLNKIYALNVDKRVFTKMLYLAAKYYLINILGMPFNSDSVQNYAMTICEADSPYIINEVDGAFKEEDYTNINSFITAIQNHAYMISQSLASLTTRDYVYEFTKTYHPSMMFFLEHFTYFMFNVEAVTIGAYLNNQAVLENIVGKSGAKLYSLVAGYQY